MFAVKSVALVRVLSNMASKYHITDADIASYAHLLHNSACIGEDGADLYPLPSRQLRLVSNAIAGVAPSLISAVTNPGTQEGDSLLKHVQALTQHIQQALAISAHFPRSMLWL